MKPSQTIAIIGGGFSGISVAAQLAKQAKEPINILIFNYKYPVTKGVAYHTTNDQHLLNVPASGMSFFADAPYHFVEWLGKNYPDKFLSQAKDHNDSFIARGIYGQYITEVFNEQILYSNANYRLIEDEVTDVLTTNEGYSINTLNYFSATCNKIVFALGNDEPEIPSYITHEMMNEGVYVNNPWMQESQRINDKQKDILLLGSGLTMVDNLISLLDNGFKGKVHVVSTKGFLPIAFRKSNTDYEIINELQPPYEINTVFDIFRKHVHRVHEQGISGGAVVAALRPLTQKIWIELSLKERIRFLSHVRHLWGVARHRLPLQPYDLLMDLVKQGRVKITAGRLANVEYSDGNATAIIRQRKSSDILSLPVQRIINCTGPLNNISKSTHPLLQNLLRKNIVEADDLKLGLRATEEGHIVVKDQPSENLFTIGLMLKGVLWETTAVNEIRYQAYELTRHIIHKFSNK